MTCGWIPKQVYIRLQRSLRCWVSDAFAGIDLTQKYKSPAGLNFVSSFHSFPLRLRMSYTVSISVSVFFFLLLVLGANG